MLKPSFSSRLGLRLVLLVAVFALVASACSSGNESDTPEAADATGQESSSDEGAENDEDTTAGDATNSEALGEAECLEIISARTLILGTGNNLFLVEDPATIEEVFSDEELDKVEAAIELLRPYQDVEGVLGTMREGLDNLSADILAVREGRLEDRTGDYGLARINGVMPEICG